MVRQNQQFFKNEMARMNEKMNEIVKCLRGKSNEAKKGQERKKKRKQSSDYDSEEERVIKVERSRDKMKKKPRKNEEDQA